MHAQQTDANLGFPQPSPDMVEFESLRSSIHHICQRNNFLNSERQELIKMQKFEQISFPKKEEIDQKIEEYSTKFEALLNEVRHLIARGQQLQSFVVAQCRQNMLPSVQQMLNTLNNIQHTLIYQSLLITKQPNSIQSKGKQIETDVRLVLTNISSTTVVRVRIINISDAEMLEAGRIKCAAVVSQGTIENNQLSMVPQGNCSLLKDIGNRKKLNNAQRQTVTELKCVLLYEIEPNEELTRMFGLTDVIWATSFPIILITHTKQLMDAYATIVWDRAFGKQDTVEWSEIAFLLKTVFAHLSGSRERYVTDKDLQYFRMKMNICGATVSYHQFCKAKIGPRQEFTFWTWLYSCCQLVQTKLLPYWDNGYIIGFSSREESLRELGKLDKPAFLLRFSDSELGALAVSFFVNNSNGEKIPYQCLLNEPLPDKKTSLVTLLKDFNQLRFVRYICLVNYETKDKGLFFDDKKLAAEAVEGENKTPNGYHKIRLSLSVVGGHEDMQEEDQNVDDTAATPGRVSHSGTTSLDSFPSPSAQQAVASTFSNAFEYPFQQQPTGPAYDASYEPIDFGNAFGNLEAPHSSHYTPCEMSMPMLEVPPFASHEQPANNWQQPTFPIEQDQRLHQQVNNVISNWQQSAIPYAQDQRLHQQPANHWQQSTVSNEQDQRRPSEEGNSVQKMDSIDLWNYNGSRQ